MLNSSCTTHCWTGMTTIDLNWGTLFWLEKNRNNLRLPWSRCPNNTNWGRTLRQWFPEGKSTLAWANAVTDNTEVSERSNRRKRKDLDLAVMSQELTLGLLWYPSISPTLKQQTEASYISSVSPTQRVASGYAFEREYSAPSRHHRRLHGYAPLSSAFHTSHPLHKYIKSNTIWFSKKRACADSDLSPGHCSLKQNLQVKKNSPQKHQRWEKPMELTPVRGRAIDYCHSVSDRKARALLCWWSQHTAIHHPSSPQDQPSLRYSSWEPVGERLAFCMGSSQAHFFLSFFFF